MELCSMLCDSLDGRRILGRMDTCIVNWLYSNTKEKDLFQKKRYWRASGELGSEEDEHTLPGRHRGYICFGQKWLDALQLDSWIKPVWDVKWA